MATNLDWDGSDINDVASSVKCDGQCAIVAFKDRNFAGDSKLFDGSQSHLSGFNDKLSSALVIPERICVTLYEHMNYKGASVRLCRDVSLVGIGFNDKVSSLKVECKRKCTAILFEHDDSQGSAKSFSGSVSYVGEEWNDMYVPLNFFMSYVCERAVSDRPEKSMKICLCRPGIMTNSKGSPPI